MEPVWMIGGDRRSYWAAQVFRVNGMLLGATDVPGEPSEPLPRTLRRVVLPFPSFGGELIRGSAAVTLDTLRERCGAESTVFGGLFGERRSALEAVGAAVHDLYGTEPLTTANAVPTAEGAVALALEHSPVTLHGSRCLVIGFGRVGKVLAEKLRALNAEVTVAVRKDGDEALAEAMGLHTDRTGNYRHGLGQYDFLFNTVPAPTLSNAQLDLLAPDALLIELASKPGGFSSEHRANCLNAPGLPGKFAPKTAGTLYANSILRILESEESL